MLPETYRFQIFNESGETIAIAGATIKGLRYNYNSQAVIQYEAAEAALYSNAGGINDAAYDESAAIDNSSDLFIGGHFELTVTTPATPDGNVSCFLQRSTDGGTTWDDDGLGELVAVINFAAAATLVKSFEL